MLKGTWPHSIPEKGGACTSGLLVIALCGVSLDSTEEVIFMQADRKRQKGSETSRWKLKDEKSVRNTREGEHFFFQTELVQTAEVM